MCILQTNYVLGSALLIAKFFKELLLRIFNYLKRFYFWNNYVSVAGNFSKLAPVLNWSKAHYMRNILHIKISLSCWFNSIKHSLSLLNDKLSSDTVIFFYQYARRYANLNYNFLKKIQQESVFYMLSCIVRFFCKLWF